MKSRFIMPYSSENKDYFTLLPFEKRIVSDLERVLRSEKGIFVLCGHQGSGKTSLKNIALENVKKYGKGIIIDIPYFVNNQELYREILVQLSRAIPQEIINMKLDAEREFCNDRLLNLDISKLKKQFENERIDNREIAKLLKKIKRLKNQQEGLSQRFCLDKSFLDILEYYMEKIVREINASQERKSLFIRALTKFMPEKMKSNRLNDNDLIPISFKDICKAVDRLSLVLDHMTEMINIYNDIEDLEKMFDFEIQNEVRYGKQESTQIVDRESHIDRNSHNYSTGLRLSCTGLDSAMSLHMSREKKMVHGEESIKNKIISSSYDVKKSITFEEKLRVLIKVLKQLESLIPVSLIIDELDKHPVGKLIHIVHDNKRLFFDCNLTTIFITDIFSAVYAEENSTYISRKCMILVKSLGLIDFIIRAKNKETYNFDYNSNNFLLILRQYYSSEMNNREIGIVREERDLPRGDISLLFYCFLYSEFYLSLTPEYKEIFIKYFWEFLCFLGELRIIKWADYDLFVKNFFQKNKIESVKLVCLFQRLKEIMQNNNWNFIFALGKFSDYSYEVDYIMREELNVFLDQIANKIYSNFGQNGLSLSNIEINKIEHGLNAFFTKCFSSTSFMDYLIRAYKKGTYKTINNKSIRWISAEFYNSGEGINDAKKIVNREDVIAVILFYPYNNRENAVHYQKPLQNGILVAINDFSEIILYPYIGYIGLHSHQPYLMEEFKIFLNRKGVKIYEVDTKNDNLIWGPYFNEDGKENKEGILKFCESRIDEWLQNLNSLE